MTKGIFSSLSVLLFTSCSYLQPVSMFPPSESNYKIDLNIEDFYPNSPISLNNNLPFSTTDRNGNRSIIIPRQPQGVYHLTVNSSNKRYDFQFELFSDIQIYCRKKSFKCFADKK